MRRTLLIFIVLLTVCWAGNPKHPNNPTQGILLVGDQVDGVQNPQFYQGIYFNALIDSEYYYTYWDHALMGSPTFADIAPYRVIIWFFGSSCGYPASNPQYSHACLSPAEEDLLLSWLDSAPGDRSLALFGMFAAWNTVADAVHNQQYYDSLFSLHLALVYPDDNFDNWIQVTDSWKVVGVAGDPITNGKTFTLNWASFLNYPDQLEPRADAGGVASGAWRDPDGNLHHQAIIRSQHAKPGGGTYRTALFACPLESYQEREDRAEIMGNMLSWFGVSSSLVETQTLGKIRALYR